VSPADVLVAGESLVDFFPVGGLSGAENDTFRRRAGGAPANVAAAMGNLDAPPLLWTYLGDDALGEFLRATLDETPVRPRFIIQRENASTGIALVDETVRGGFTLYLEGTATADFDPADLPETVFVGLEWIHLGGVLLAYEPTRSAMFDLLERAEAHGCTISFDPNTRPSIWPSTGECVTVLDRVLDSVDVVVGHTDDFPTAAFADDATALIAELLNRGVSAAFVTKGAAGAEMETRTDSPWGKHRGDHSGFDVAVEDTTGAGDAFTAATIVGLREENTSPTEALELASASGAITTTETGAIAALPNRSTVRAWLENHYGTR